ncbi:MAG: metallophosphoesterase [Muribaculaceae bacterium]|nr:metallophosphoesterase [Muribaculaceae bacterium]
MWMIIFLALPLLGLAYVGWHVWTLVPLPAIWRFLLVVLGVASFLMLFLNLGRVIDRMPMPVARAVYDIGNSSIFVLLYLVIIFLLLDLGRLLHVVRGTWLHHNFPVTAAIAIGLFAVFLYGNIHYHDKKRVELSLTTGKPLARPLRIVMVSDLHLGYHNPRKELARWVDMINGEEPDLVLVAGDIIDMSMRPLVEERMADELRRIAAPVYACLGNHEYYSNEPRAVKFYHDAGIRLLRDTCVTVGDLCLIGRDDRTNPHRRSIAQLAKTADHTRYTIVLDHQPYHLERTERAGIDFQFSGHTHEGQVWPISWITQSLYECAFGPHQRGHTRYYVSSGLGIWGGKFRIGTRSEYVVATLTKENK